MSSTKPLIALSHGSWTAMLDLAQGRFAYARHDPWGGDADAANYQPGSLSRDKPDPTTRPDAPGPARPA